LLPVNQHSRKSFALEDGSAIGFQHWLRMFFRRLARIEATEDIEKEIQILIDEGEERGLISEDEGEMIQGIFSFRDTIAREIMVPRTEVVCARAEEANLIDIIKLIEQSGHSRIPLYQESVDNIIGILHAKDLLSYWGSENADFREMVRAPYFIPETKKISEVLKDLRDKKSHMAIVIDEYGGTAGILTLEDIIEEIIGEVMDEYDAEEKLITDNEDGSITVDARLDIDELEDYIHVKLPEGKFESVGGFVISLLGRVPNVDEKIEFQNIEMIIEDANNRKIEKIRIRNVDQNRPQLSSDEETFL